MGLRLLPGHPQSFHLSRKPAWHGHLRLPPSNSSSRHFALRTNCRSKREDQPSEKGLHSSSAWAGLITNNYYHTKRCLQQLSLASQLVGKQDLSSLGGAAVTVHPSMNPPLPTPPLAPPFIKSSLTTVLDLKEKQHQAIKPQPCAAPSTPLASCSHSQQHLCCLKTKCCWPWGHHGGDHHQPPSACQGGSQLLQPHDSIGHYWFIASIRAPIT